MITTRFLTHDDFMEIRKKAGTMTAFDWNCMDGNTIAEKYEPLYVKLVEVTNVVIRKGGSGYFWIATSPEMATVFQSTMAFKDSPTEYLPQGTGDIQWIGTVNRKWRLYTDPQFPVNEILIGCTEVASAEPKYFALMKVANFVAGDDDESTTDMFRMLCQSLGVAPGESHPEPLTRLAKDTVES
jgi:hypothetical protein